MKPQKAIPVPRVFSADKNLNLLLENVVQDVTGYANRLLSQIRELSDIGRALSGVDDLNVLLEMIVDKARSFTHADAGTLFIKEGDRLRFMIVQNDTLHLRMGGKTGDAIPFPPVELNQANVSAFVALNGISVNIPDVYNTALFDFTDPKTFDQATGYRTKSMLVVLMKNHEDEVIGVLQLLNAKDLKTGEVIPFSSDCEHLTESLASQAAIAISNVKLIYDMETLFEAFVKVMATAIDQKSPATGGHIRRMANLTLTLAEVIHKKKEGVFKDVRFTPEQKQQLRIAGWMHDIGKVTTPVEIIEKSKKLQNLFDRMHHIHLRLDYIRQTIKNDHLQKKLALMQDAAPASACRKLESDTRKKIRDIEEIRSFLDACNEPGETMPEEHFIRLRAIARKTYLDEQGRVRPYLTDNELEHLSVPRGSLTEGEREKIKEHAYITLKMLRQIPFTKKLKDIPHFAAAHHECLNGTGYPLGLKGDQIPFEGKLMAVTDIAEALTAQDRPYKKPMDLDKVYRVLRQKVEKGELDRDLVELFINEGVYEIYQDRYERDSQDREEPAGQGHEEPLLRVRPKEKAPRFKTAS